MGYNFKKRASRPGLEVEAKAVQGSRFSKSLVRQQLRGIFNYDLTSDTDKSALTRDTELIQKYWETTNESHLLRPRFIQIKKALIDCDDREDVVIVSGYNGMNEGDYEYRLIFINFANFQVYMGIPVQPKLMKILGGEYTVSRIVALAGISGLINEMTETLGTVEGYEDKDRFRSNIELLKFIRGGLE